MTKVERVAKRMFEAFGKTTTYGKSWDEASKPVQDVWLNMAAEAILELLEMMREDASLR